MFLIGVPCQEQRPAAINGEAEVPSSSKAFVSNPGSMGRTALSVNRSLPRNRVSGHLTRERRDRRSATSSYGS